ncbi:MAG TPA: Fe-S protein assembly co-chaperone HscB [Burkholderiales bacterium]
MQSHFQLFGIEPAFALDALTLERAYRDIQSRIHPDRFAQSGDAERRASMQWATRVNEAYRVLKSPLERARYLLELNGVDAGFETNTSMPVEFLERQLELREALDAAGQAQDRAALDALRDALRAERDALERTLAERLDGARDWAGAAGALRQLRFFEKLDEEIDAALDGIEG